MNKTTTAIVLCIRRKGDNSSLLEVYTRDSGRRTFLLYGHKWQSNLLPMSLVTITASNPNREVSAVSQVERYFVPQHTDIRRQCIALLMAEAIEKSMRLPMADETLYDWLEDQVKQLDQLEETDQDYPLAFLTHMSELLGYGGVMIDEWRDLKSLDIIERI
ncbi:MAG: DNA repair protein RecO [Paludibacteraceae bacterium]|nr:DNA repair protein RecO [Paludibacteraceae bacterium]